MIKRNKHVVDIFSLNNVDLLNHLYSLLLSNISEELLVIDTHDTHTKEIFTLSTFSL